MYYMGVEKDQVEPSRRDMHSDIKAIGAAGTDGTDGTPPSPLFTFTTAAELHRLCVENNMTIAQVVWENEKAFRTEDEIKAGLLKRTCMLFSFSLASPRFSPPQVTDVPH